MSTFSIASYLPAFDTAKNHADLKSADAAKKTAAEAALHTEWMKKVDFKAGVNALANKAALKDSFDGVTKTLSDKIDNIPAGGSAAVKTLGDHGKDVGKVVLGALPASFAASFVNSKWLNPVKLAPALSMPQAIGAAVVGGGLVALVRSLMKPAKKEVQSEVRRTSHQVA